MPKLNPRLYRSARASVDTYTSTPVSEGSEAVTYGRVLDVIMDSSHPKWKELGGSQALYGVFFQKLYSGDEVRSSEVGLNFAYCRQSTFRRAPLKNEIVSLVPDIRVDASEEYNKIKTERLYWGEIVPVWNSPHLNAYPDTVRDGNGPADTGKNFVESNKIRPLQLCDGDVTVEGRHGNTIRFGGTQGTGSSVATKDTNGSPYILARVGQVDTSEDTVSEDINKDRTSIYLLADHKVNLNQANSKRKAWLNGKGPVEAKDYKGSQIIANANRVFLNARENDIELSAKEEIGLNGKLVALDGKDYVAFDADKIYLGKSAFHEINPALLGDQVTSWLSQLCSVLNNLLTTMGSTVSPGQLPALAAAALASQVSIKALGSSSNLDGLKSKKAFVE